MTGKLILLTMAVAAVMADPIAHAEERPGAAPFDVAQGARQMQWRPSNPALGQELRVQRPDGSLHIETFHPGMVPTWELESGVTQDGLYSWELTQVVSPPLDPGRAGDAGVGHAGKGIAAAGYFSVENGTMVPLDLEEPKAAKGPVRGKAAAGKQVISGDLTVYNSLCVGFDCATSESFGADTVRLKENNLRIHFEDTSTASSFPSRDWRIVANDQANGGASYLAFQDVNGGRMPFLVEAAAPASSLYVDSTGRVGFGTGSPVLEMHARDGDTPGLRLDQDTSNGFASQVWDIAGNETSFFVRDATNGSTLPFRIRPGAASNSLVIDSDNDVGIGVLSPDSALHVQRPTGAQILVENTSATAAERVLMNLRNNGKTRFAMVNSEAGATWTFDNAGSSFQVSRVGTGIAEFVVFDNGNATHTGEVTATNFNTSSSVSVKDQISPVDEVTILDKLEMLPIREWSYKEQPGKRHVGPMAEEFYSMFGLGPDNKHITATDLAGVALAASKALQAENEKLRDDARKKDSRIESLEARINRLEALVLDAE